MSTLDTTRLLAETFVRHVEAHEELGSTNDRALELAADDAIQTPLLVIAERQTGGRGRGANRWWSAAGSLTFSLVLSVERWKIPTQRWPTIALTAGLAVCEALHELLCANSSTITPPWLPGATSPETGLRLKWPNDVLLDDRKLCGILVEAPGVRLRRVVVGIGMNVNNSRRDAPADVRERATSIVDSLQRTVDSSDLPVSLLRHLESHLARLRADSAGLARRWRERCALTGRVVSVETGNALFTGRCCGIDETGALLLATETGTERVVSGVVTRFE